MNNKKENLKYNGYIFRAIGHIDISEVLLAPLVNEGLSLPLKKNHPPPPPRVE